ncbi:MAG TPA: autotransporter outer membrane beta-barrel domain-containing protein, partial [Verrucomicrobiae bacterium]|nr:autotransporter outer membrane beta-barrel domain-containing protein [Verrucomicrobiae bacterium]
YFNGSIRADKYISLPNGFAFTPYLALNETRMSLSPTKETGAGALNIDTVYQGDSFLTLQPGFELGGKFASKNWEVRPHIDFFATHFIGNNQTSLPALLQGQPTWLGPLTFNNTIDRTLWNVSPTIDFGGSRGFDMRLGGNYQFSNNMHAGTMWINLSQKVGPTPYTP